MAAVRAHAQAVADVTTAITPRQAEVLRFIEATIATRGYAPTLREIATRLGVTTNSVSGHLWSLTVRGYIERDPRKSRAIRVLRRAPVRAEAFVAPRDAVTGTVRVVLPRGDGVALYWQIKTNEAAECAA